MAVMPFFHVYGLTVVMSLAVQGAAAMIRSPKIVPKGTRMFDVGRNAIAKKR